MARWIFWESGGFVEKELKFKMRDKEYDKEEKRHAEKYIFISSRAFLLLNFLSLVLSNYIILPPVPRQTLPFVIFYVPSYALHFLFWQDMTPLFLTNIHTFTQNYINSHSINIKINTHVFSLSTFLLFLHIPPTNNTFNIIFLKTCVNLKCKRYLGMEVVLV